MFWLWIEALAAEEEALLLPTEQPDGPADASRDPEEPPQESVDELVARARDGDNDAFSELAGLFERFVYHTAYRALSTGGISTDSAEDVAQEALLKAWRNLRSFRGECSFSTWLFRITVNTARDSIRSQVRRPAVSLTRTEDDAEDGEEWDVPVTSGDEVPEDALERKETIRAIRQAIEELPEEQRQVIVMRDLHELPYQEIADTLHLELGTVKSRLNRGRASLKAILLEKGIF